jgi:nucleotide-binding universal stress UspA family protein
MNSFDEKNASWRDSQSEREDRGPRSRRFLVPLGLSECSHEALAAAVLFARTVGGQVVLLHALELNIAGEERGIGRLKLLHELMSAAELRLTELAHSMCGDVAFSVVVGEGPPGEVILRTAQALGVDAILMGPRRQRGLRWLRRNNLRAVLSRTRRPVYVVVPTRHAPTTFMKDGRHIKEWLYLPRLQFHRGLNYYGVICIDYTVAKC